MPEAVIENSLPAQVVIDSSVFIQDIWMRGASFAVLRGLFERTPTRLLVPAVVVGEVKNKYRELLRVQQKRYRDASQAFEKIANREQHVTDAQEELEALAAKFDSDFDRALAAMSAEITTYPDISHEQLVERDLLRRKPFSEKGTGYRDALVWASVLKLAMGATGRIAFLTANTKDFALEGELHPDLVLDLRQNSLDSGIVRLYELREFVESYARPALEQQEREDRTRLERDKRLEAARDELSRGEFRGKSLEERISLAIQNEYQHRDFEGGRLGFPSEFETVSLDMILGITSYEISEIDFLGPDEIFAELTVEADAEFDVFVYRADVPLLEERYYAQIGHFDFEFDHYAHISDSKSVEVQLQIVLDDRSGEVQGIDVGEMSQSEEH